MNSQSMRNGQFRHFVTIQQATAPTDGETVRTWTDQYAEVPAEIVNVSGGETLRGRQVEATVNAVIRHHWVDGITSQHRYTHGSDTFEITSVFDDGVDGDRNERSRYLRAHCTKVPA